MDNLNDKEIEKLNLFNLAEEDLKELIGKLSLKANYNIIKENS